MCLRQSYFLLLLVLAPCNTYAVNNYFEITDLRGIYFDSMADACLTADILSGLANIGESTTPTVINPSLNSCYFTLGQTHVYYVKGYEEDPSLKETDVIFVSVIVLSFIGGFAASQIR